MIRDLDAFTEEGRKPEVSGRSQSISKVLQPVSDLNRYPGARSGDIILGLGAYQDIVIPREKGVALIFVSGSEVYVEWPPGPVSSTGPEDEHLIRPPDAERVPNSYKWRRRNGNSLESTIKLHALAQVGDGWPLVLFNLKGTALKPASKALSDASRVRVQIGGKEALVIGATWQMNSEQVKGESGIYFVPTFKLLALAGSPGGPSQECLLRAWDLRRELKLSEDEARDETIKLFAAQSRAMIEHVPAPQRGTTTITSGLASLAERRPDLAPSGTGKPPFDDPIPW